MNIKWNIAINFPRELKIKIYNSTLEESTFITPDHFPLTNTTNNSIGGKSRIGMKIIHVPCLEDNYSYL